MKRRKFFLKRSVKWHFSFIKIGDKHEMKNQIGFLSKTITDPTVTQVKTYIKAAGLHLSAFSKFETFKTFLNTVRAPS